MDGDGAHGGDGAGNGNDDEDITSGGKKILLQMVFDFSLKGNGWVQYVLLALRFVICPSMH